MEQLAALPSVDTKFAYPELRSPVTQSKQTVGVTFAGRQPFALGPHASISDNVYRPAKRCPHQAELLVQGEFWLVLMPMQGNVGTCPLRFE
jgi:hypothetical protein